MNMHRFYTVFKYGDYSEYGSYDKGNYIYKSPLSLFFNKKNDRPSPPLSCRTIGYTALGASFGGAFPLIAMGALSIGATINPWLFLIALPYFITGARAGYAIGESLPNEHNRRPGPLKK